MRKILFGLLLLSSTLSFGEEAEVMNCPLDEIKDGASLVVKDNFQTGYRSHFLRQKSGHEKRAGIAMPYEVVGKPPITLAELHPIYSPYSFYVDEEPYELRQNSNYYKSANKWIIDHIGNYEDDDEPLEIICIIHRSY